MEILWLSFLTDFLKLYGEICALNSSGRICHILGPKKEILSLPWYTVQIEGILKPLRCFRL